MIYLFLCELNDQASLFALYFFRREGNGKRQRNVVGGGKAFGELNYLKPAQEQAPFMSGSTQCRLCASRIHVLRARVHVRVRSHVGRHECANNEGKFVPRSH